MKTKYVLGLALVAMFVVPGSASEFLASPAAAMPTVRSTGSTGGLFYDPDGEPRLSITLPTRFTAIDTSGDPALSFAR